MACCIQQGLDSSRLQRWHRAFVEFTAERFPRRAHTTSSAPRAGDESYPGRQRTLADHRWRVAQCDCASLDAASIIPLSLPHILTRHEGNIEIIEVSGDNRWLATYGTVSPETGDYVEAPLRLWDLTTKDPGIEEPIALKGDIAQMTGVVFSDDGQWMVSLGEKPMIWNLRTIRQDPSAILLKGHDGEVWAAAFDHDGRWLITGGSDRTVRMWDLTTNNPSGTSEILGRHNRFGDIGVIAISPDDRWVVTGEGFGNYCEDCEAKIWDLDDSGSANRLRATLVGHTKPIKRILLTSDSQRAITASEDGTARIWDLRTLEL